MEYIINLCGLNSNNQWLKGLIETVFVLLAYSAFLVLKNSLILKLVRRTFAKLNLFSEGALFNNFIKFGSRALALIVVSLIAGSFPLPGKVQLVIQDGLFVVLTTLVLLFSYDILDHISIRLSATGAAEFKPLFTKIFKTLFACFALMFVMRHFNYDIWHIVTALGIGSLAVGLAAQPTLSNMIAGFTLLIDRPFRPGDHIQIAGGSEGDVLHIGMRSTWVQTNEGNVLIVPNSELVNSRLINFNYPDPGISQKVRYQFEFEQEVSSIKETLKAAAEIIPDIISDSIKIFCSGISDGKLEITLFYKIASFSGSDLARDQIIEVTLKALREKGITLAPGVFITATKS